MTLQRYYVTLILFLEAPINRVPDEDICDCNYRISNHIDVYVAYG